jgi:hypothetical protein
MASSHESHPSPAPGGLLSHDRLRTGLRTGLCDSLDDTGASEARTDCRPLTHGEAEAQPRARVTLVRRPLRSSDRALADTVATGPEAIAVAPLRSLPCSLHRWGRRRLYGRGAARLGPASALRRLSPRWLLRRRFKLSMSARIRFAMGAPLTDVSTDARPRSRGQAPSGPSRSALRLPRTTPRPNGGCRQVRLPRVTRGAALSGVSPAERSAGARRAATACRRR